MNKHKIIEGRYSKYFCDWYNNKHSTQYKLVDVSKEDSDVDVLMKCNNSILKLQLVDSAGEMRKHANINPRRMDNGLSPSVGDVSYIKWIDSMIAKKNVKYSDKIDLVLLIQGSMPTPNKKWFEEQFDTKYYQSEFLGIYYVSPPVRSYPETIDTKNGFVIELKPIDNKTVTNISHNTASQFM